MKGIVFGWIMLPSKNFFFLSLSLSLSLSVFDEQSFLLQCFKNFFFFQGTINFQINGIDFAKNLTVFVKDKPAWITEGIFGSNINHRALERFLIPVLIKSRNSL